MRKDSFIISILIAPFLFLCTKEQGKDPLLAHSDKAMLDSCKVSHFYYKDTMYSGKFGPHGEFKLRFNSIAFAALGKDGRLPVSGTFPSGAMLIKDVHKQSAFDHYAFMYKKNGSWIWGEIKPTGEILYSVNKDPSTCLGCHAASGNRDHALSFNHY